jgi:hypothetical protein
MSAQRADAAAAGLAATLARMAEVRGGGADGGGDDDGGAKSGPRQISYKQERATHDQASARECHRPTQRRSQECRAARARRARRRGRATATGRHDQKPRGGGARARRARRRGRATATGRHDQKPRGGGWGEQARLPHHTPGESCADAQASRRRPPDPRPLPCAPAAATRSPPPRRARRRRRPSAHRGARASPPPPPPRDTLLPTLPPRPPRERASVLNRGDPSPIYTRRPGTYKRASGSSSSGGDSGDSGAAGTIIISITASRRWRGQRGLVLGCSRPCRLHPERYRLATARGGALPWLWGSDQGPFFPVFFLWATNS